MTTETNLTILPPEIQGLAEQVKPEKRAEVATVLNQIFSGTKDWERQVDAIEVKGIDDKMSIQMADAARKNAKNYRVEKEKIFDAKRAEVQQSMIEFKTEDSLWLKAKQIMQISLKAIEDKAEWKAKFAERFEAEQKELRNQLRIEKVSKFNPEIQKHEIESMTDQMFDLFLTGIGKAYNDKIQAEKEAEEKRQAEIQAEKERIEKQRLENLRLQKEAEEREKAFAKEREIAAAKQKEIEEKAKSERLINELKLKKEAEEREKLQNELRAKQVQEAKEKAERERVEAERVKAEQNALKAPKKDKMKVWVNGLEIGCPPGMEADLKVLEIKAKFESFKNWAISQIETI